jgi:hypothetical protein
VGELLAWQSACRTTRTEMPERIGTPVAGMAHPLTNGSLAYAKRLGHPALGTPLRLEGPGLKPSRFCPIGR